MVDATLDFVLGKIRSNTDDYEAAFEMIYSIPGTNSYRIPGQGACSRDLAIANFNVVLTEQPQPDPNNNNQVPDMSPGQRHIAQSYRPIYNEKAGKRQLGKTAGCGGVMAAATVLGISALPVLEDMLTSPPTEAAGKALLYVAAGAATIGSLLGLKYLLGGNPNNPNQPPQNLPPRLPGP